MVKLEIAVNSYLLQRLQSALSMIEKKGLPKTAETMGKAAENIRDVWMNYAGGGSLPGVKSLEHPKGEYAKSIYIEPKGHFDYEVRSDAEVAAWIEYGTKTIDMKDTHTKGPRSRIMQSGPNKGKPYLIVPFQWGTEEGSGFKNIVPKSIQSLMLSAGFKASTVNDETYQSPNAQGQMVDRWKYNWGNSIKSGGANIKGLVRFEQGTQEKRHGGYFTFRIIPSWGKGWVKKETPARHVTKAVADFVRKDTEDGINAAIMEDLGV